jgi:hypothetical protein
MFWAQWLVVFSPGTSHASSPSAFPDLKKGQRVELTESLWSGTPRFQSTCLLWSNILVPRYLKPLMSCSDASWAVSSPAPIAQDVCSTASWPLPVSTGQ